MDLRYEAAGTMGKFASERLKIFRGDVWIGVADYEPILDKFYFEPVTFGTDSDVITNLQRRQKAGEQISELDFTDALSKREEAIAAAKLTADELVEVKGYVLNLPAPTQTPALEPEPPDHLPIPPAPIVLPAPDLRLVLPWDSSEVEKLKDQVGDLTAQVESLATRLAALEGQGARLSALEAQFKIHIGACPISIARRSAFGGGFTP
jgi:hypothetical protein